MLHPFIGFDIPYPFASLIGNTHNSRSSFPLFHFRNYTHITYLKKNKNHTPIVSLTLYLYLYVFIYFLSLLSHSKHPIPIPYLKPTEFSKGFSKFQPLRVVFSTFFYFFSFCSLKDLEFC